MLIRTLLFVAIALPLFAAGPVRNPVLVELFTSQGCSSCPPADDVLAKLEGENVIVLSEHVDYWNRLGWKDPYSSRQYSLRQTEYGHLFRQQGVYTPQMVINGRVELIGSDEELARREIKRASTTQDIRPANVQIALKQIDRKNVAVFSLSVDSLPLLNVEDSAQVWLAVTESGMQTDVKAGENTGRKLTHVGVVRTLVQAFELQPEAKPYTALAKVTLQPEWKLDRLKAVLFVQEKKAKRVIGVAAVRLVAARPIVH